MEIGLRGGHDVVIGDDREREYVPHLTDQPGDVIDRSYVCCLIKEDTLKRHEYMERAMERGGSHEEDILVAIDVDMFCFHKSMCNH